MSSQDASLNFRVPSQPHLSRVVREAVASFAALHHVDDEDMAHFLTALGEALANAIEHSGATEPIDVDVRIGDDRIVATVRDTGVGFACDRAAEQHLPDPQAERGRGLPIMQRCCDIFSIESTPGNGTLVQIGRILRAPIASVASASPASVA